jgi:bifunctional non-homologous end joining protein LigD
MAAALAPHDEPDVRGERLPQRHRSGLAFLAGSGHLFRMPISLPRGAVPANLPADIRLQIVSPCARPPEGDGWLHEIKHDGHRLVAIVPSRGQLKLLSRNGHDRTPLFHEPFRSLSANGQPIVLDGEIAVADERGITHIDHLLQDAFGRRGPDRLTYFAFDLLYLDGHDLRRCPIEERKALLRHVLEEAGCDRIVYVDHIIGRGAELFERIQEIGAEGIVSKRIGTPYRGRESRDWLKTKCHQLGEFVITGFEELGEGRLEAVYVAEEIAGALKPAGQIRFGFAGKGLWVKLDALRSGPAHKRVVPVVPSSQARIKFFGRYKRGSIRDGVILSLHARAPAPRAAQWLKTAGWSCDSDEVIAAFDRADSEYR